MIDYVDHVNSLLGGDCEEVSCSTIFSLVLGRNFNRSSTFKSSNQPQGWFLGTILKEGDKMYKRVLFGLSVMVATVIVWVANIKSVQDGGRLDLESVVWAYIFMIIAETALILGRDRFRPQSIVILSFLVALVGGIFIRILSF